MTEPSNDLDATQDDAQVENTDATPELGDGDQSQVSQDPASEEDAQAEVEMAEDDSEDPDDATDPESEGPA
jgi:hypothetical protein